MARRYKNNRILAFGDTHSPYHHPDTINFLQAVIGKYEPDRFVHMGDLTDSYCFNRYSMDVGNMESYTEEFKGVRKFVKQLGNLIPDMLLCSSNHDDRLWNRAKVGGIPKEFIVPFLKVVGGDQFNWKLSHEHILRVESDRNYWYFCHTRAGTTINMASSQGMSAVTGHNHNMFNIIRANTLSGVRYGVDTPSLLDNNRHAFAYNNMNIKRPNLGCVMIINGVPKMIPMDLKGKSNNWNKKIV